MLKALTRYVPLYPSFFLLSLTRTTCLCFGLQEGVTYAIQQLNELGVYMYADAGHAGWLGWPANLSPAAQLFNQLYTGAGSPQYWRGLATNVANYNALR